MKFTVVFVLVACLQVKATTYAQNVSLNVRNASLSQVLAEIKKQSGYNFFYNDAMVRTGIPVTVEMKSMPVEEALKLALSNQPLSFSIVNKTVVLKDKMLAPDFTALPVPPGEMHGRVADSLGQPLIGATVRIKGSKELAITDANGLFQFKNVDDDAILIISFTGYLTKEAPVKEKGSGGKAYLFTLRRSSNPLDEVQVIAYGTNTRRYNVGNISSVSSKDIEQSGSYNIVSALAGRLPGMEIMTASGVPGSRSTMQVRGQNTLKSTFTTNGMPLDQPLIIVDGLPFASQNSDVSLFLNSFLAGNGGFSSLNGLNPSDIESISLLKDADATSIYGSQGANGVIVITTKKGKPGRNAMNIRMNTGPNKITRPLKMMNTQEYLAMRHQAAISDGIIPENDPTAFYDLLVFDTTKYTDWAKEYFGGTSNNTDAHISMSGGSTQNTYVISAGYTRSTYNFPGDFKDQRYTLHSGLSSRSTNNKFRVDFGSDISYDNNNSMANATLGKALMMSPNRPDMMDDKGNLVWFYKGVDVSNTQMLAYLKQKYNVQDYMFNNTLRLSYEVIPGLNLSVNAGYSLLISKQYSATPIASLKPDAGAASSANFGRSDNQTINIEPQVDYRRAIGEGRLTVMVGGTYKRNSLSSSQQTGTGYTDDILLGTITAAKTFSVSDAGSIYKYAGGFGRVNYIWNDKYIANITGRRDGSSNFGPDHRWGNFGSVGLGWIISEEHFMDRLKPVLSFAKITGNYGTSGSDGNAPYNYQAYWKVANPVSTPAFDGTIPYLPNNLYNPFYSWASKHSLNLGLDLGFIDDKILINGNYYRNRTGNQLTSYKLPTQTGFTTVVENMDAKVQNSGIEISVTTRNITQKDFTWTTSFNITANRNKLLSFPNLETSSYASTYKVGQPVTMQFGYKFAGVNDTTGLFQFYTRKGVITSRPASGGASIGGDIQPVVNLQTDYYGGINNSLTYKNWSLSLFFKFSKGMAYNYLREIYGGSLPGGMQNLPLVLKDQYWTKPGDHKQLQRLSSGSYMATGDGANAQRASQYIGSSSAIYSDNTYLRLKSAALSYSLPASSLKKLGIRGCQFYVNAQNLFTFTNYKFGDPEMPGYIYTIPLQLIVTGGFSLDL